MSLLLLLRSGQTFTQTITDTTGSTDTLTTAASYAPTVTDLLAGSDTSTQVAAHVATFTDSAGVTDSLGFSGATDNVGLTDSISFEVGKSFTEALGGTDSTTSGVDHALLISDDTGSSDTSSLPAGWARTAQETVGLTDSTSFNVNLMLPTDSVGLTDPFIAPHLFSQTINDDAGLTDSVSVIINFNRSLTQTDGTGIADSVSFAVVRALTINDTISGTDNLAFGRGVVFTDDAGSTDDVTTLYSPPTHFTITVDDALGGVDSSANNEDYARTIFDDAGITDTATTLFHRIIVLTVDDSVGFVDIANTSTNFHVSLTDDVGLDQLTIRDHHRGAAGRVIQMVEYINRMAD